MDPTRVPEIGSKCLWLSGSTVRSSYPTARVFTEHAANKVLTGDSTADPTMGNCKDIVGISQEYTYLGTRIPIQSL